MGPQNCCSINEALIVVQMVCCFEDWERCLEIKEMLRVRYGPRFRSMTTTPAAGSNL